MWDAFQSLIKQLHRLALYIKIYPFSGQNMYCVIISMGREIFSKIIVKINSLVQDQVTEITIFTYMEVIETKKESYAGPF